MLIAFQRPALATVWPEGRCRQAHRDAVMAGPTVGPVNVFPAAAKSQFGQAGIGGFPDGTARIHYQGHGLAVREIATRVGWRDVKP